MDIKELVKQFEALKERIIEFMQLKGYEPEDIRPSFFQKFRFLTMNFSLPMYYNNPKITYLDKIKKSLSLISEQEISQKTYFANLRSTRDDFPFKIIFHITPSKLKDNNGFIVQIRSEPTILFKMRQLALRPMLDEFTYSNIIETNKQFINEIMSGLGGTAIEKPKAIAEIVQTPFIDTLINIGFDKIAELLKQGNLKLERGDIEDGLTDLRGALEQFIKEMVGKINEKPANNIPSNLDILKKYGYLNEHLHSIIKDSLYDWIYRHISDTCVHKREKVSLEDAKLLFSISEVIMKYLIEKVVFRR